MQPNSSDYRPFKVGQSRRRSLFVAEDGFGVACYSVSEKILLVVEGFWSYCFELGAEVFDVERLFVKLLGLKVGVEDAEVGLGVYPCARAPLPGEDV